MRKIDSVKRIDLTDKERFINNSNRSELRSLPKIYSNSRSSKCSRKDRSQTQGFNTERSRQPVHEFNLLMTGQSPKRSFPQPKKPTKNNIKTYIRFKPICRSDLIECQSTLKSSMFNKPRSSIQISQDKFLKYQINEDKTVRILVNQQQQQSYTFDRIFNPESTQNDIYEETTKQLIQKFLKGYNTTIFAYGQTGSGKTYTMLGQNCQVRSISKKGIILRAVQQIFADLTPESLCNSKIASISQSNIASLKSSNINLFTSPEKTIKSGKDVSISCSLLEIYRQNLIDLLAQQNPKQLKIKQNLQGIQIDGLTIKQIENQQSVIKLLERGIEMRKTRGTDVNDHSSRSHLIFTLYLKRKINQSSYTVSKFNLVDLAGSQKVAKTKVNGQGLQQAKKINLSLSCLGNTINALSKQQDHIPFRDSKLTRILQESLSGNSVTRVIITCSILQNCKQQTISSLKFGHRLKKIKLEQNQNICKSLVSENTINKYVYNALLASYQQSESKLVKIKEIVGTSKCQNNQQIVKCLMKVIQSHGDENQWDTTGIVSPQLAKISESETVSMKNQDINDDIAQCQNINTLKNKHKQITIQKNPTKNTKRQTQQIINQYTKASHQQLIKMLIQRDRKIKRLQKQLGCCSSSKKQQKKQGNKIKIMKKTTKLQNCKENIQKQIAIVKQSDRFGQENLKINTKQVQRVSDTYQILHQLQDIVVGLNSYRNSYQKLERDILVSQVEQLLHSHSIDHQFNQQINNLITYRNQYVNKMQYLLYQELIKIQEYIQQILSSTSTSTSNSNSNLNSTSIKNQHILDTSQQPSLCSN